MFVFSALSKFKPSFLKTRRVELMMYLQTLADSEVHAQSALFRAFVSMPQAEEIPMGVYVPP
jgi:hypothetical protein